MLNTVSRKFDTHLMEKVQQLQWSPVKPYLAKPSKFPSLWVFLEIVKVDIIVDVKA